MDKYEKIQCACGKDARIVICGVGCYIRCPYCEKSTYMCTTKEDAIKKWEIIEGRKVTMAGRCTAAFETDEYHGYGCSITEGACMFLYPDSKACAERYGEGPDAAGQDEPEPDQEN